VEPNINLARFQGITNRHRYLLIVRRRAAGIGATITDEDRIFRHRLYLSARGRRCDRVFAEALDPFGRELGNKRHWTQVFDQLGVSRKVTQKKTKQRVSLETAIGKILFWDFAVIERVLATHAQEHSG